MIVRMTVCALALMVGTVLANDTKPQPQVTSDKPKQPAAQKKADDTAAAKANEEPEEQEINGVKLLAIEVNIVSYTNQERARYGLPPLEVDKSLMQSARSHAIWMASNRSMVHTSQPVAENIAMGQPSSDSVVHAWMNSSGHRANILNSGHRRIGVAAYCTASGIIYWCQQFRR